MANDVFSAGWETVYAAQHVDTQYESFPNEDELFDDAQYVIEDFLNNVPIVRAPTGYDRSHDDLRFDIPYAEF